MRCLRRACEPRRPPCRPQLACLPSCPSFSDALPAGRGRAPRGVHSPRARRPPPLLPIPGVWRHGGVGAPGRQVARVRHSKAWAWPACTPLGTNCGSSQPVLPAVGRTSLKRSRNVPSTSASSRTGLRRRRTLLPVGRTVPAVMQPGCARGTSSWAQPNRPTVVPLLQGGPHSGDAGPGGG